MAQNSVDVVRRKPRRLHYMVAYKGDKVLAQGSGEDVAKALNVSFATLSFYLSPSYQKRLTTHQHGRCGYITIVDLDENPTMPTPKRVANYYLRHSADATAEHYNCSASTVCRYFRQVHGCSKFEYIKKQRMSKVGSV